MDTIWTIASIALSVTIILCMSRASKGPLAVDRLIAVNVIGTKTIVLIALISFILDETYFIDVILVYAMISFIASLGLSELIQRAGGERA
ncbi:multisubunit sodium/proton antiporter, MrpF subunit [Peptoclostridium litorale DSM 5388]|uniref:Uncharacterized protein n=1 Tax=Peptoclostridium litorale DSM 5388 TaxID=1121324 RepID=A0A069REH1_PEPLI|nr:monovalent cation/H+ antiporter complex subunit F [Peptoclostridium litorale]KDR94575.1 hypothetical protein CLIT_14c00360 [Peptoclostridium litorale DSM 5388]SIO31610.1 multisubunit sodium/proton antiporter, MrpF subunit [Peptoclostridium litorale DSM 5388]